MFKGGKTGAHRRPQVYQLLLSRVIDVKYGCFAFLSPSSLPFLATATHAAESYLCIHRTIVIQKTK